jgi:hypothetical protein
VFQRKVRRALRHDRQRVAFAAEIAATFGRAELEAMLGGYAGLSDEALIADRWRSNTEGAAS